MSKIGDNGGPPLRDAGWYATHRDMLNHPIVGIGKPVKPADPTRGSVSRFEAWHWLIANAAYGERDWLNKGQRQTIQPGQLVAGRQYLAHLWNWTEKTVRVFLKQLLDEQMITLATDAIRGQQRANTANIITLCNYIKYQLSSDDEKADEGPAKGQPRATEGPAKGQIEYKETNKQIPTPEARDGEVHVSNGVYVNCETVRHKDFTINLLGVEMQLLGTVPMAEIKSVAVGHALEWATDIAAGRPPRDVLPRNGVTNWVAKTFRYKKLDSEVNDVRKAKVASRQVPREKGQSFSEMTAELLEQIDREQRR